MTETKTRRFPQLGAAIDGLFDGYVSPWSYTTLRVALGVVFLVRHSDWLRPWVHFEHYRWVHGLDFLERAPEAPALSSPLIPGLALGDVMVRILVYARTALAVLLVVGVVPRLAALLLAAVSYVLLASDRYHYLHHLHLLYASIAWLSLAPLDMRASVEHRPSPIWPLQLIRAFVVSVYAASGFAKLDAAWLRGDTLRDLHELNVVGGPMWALGERVLGAATVARSVCVLELSLPVLLVLPRTRRGAVFVAWSFHALISSVMGVSTFGVEMAILLSAFWHTEKRTYATRVQGDAPR